MGKAKDKFLSVLGDEMRHVRKSRGWTRRGLLLRAPFEASVQTLATYELGTRHMSVARFVEIADVLAESPVRMLARVRRRLGAETDGRLVLDLSVAGLTQCETLAPLRRWARCRLQDSPAGLTSTSLHLDGRALDLLADVCGTATDDLIWQLIRTGIVQPVCDGHRIVSTVESVSACQE